MLKRLFDNNCKITLLLFLATFLYYLFYFKYAFLHLNTVLAGNSGDTIKNYFTFLYHTTIDKGAIEFTGMNYPYGEHTVYTDSQPLLVWIFRLLPFTHNYLVGILHALMFFSYIITPGIYFKIFDHFKLNKIVSVLCSVAIVFLSPQLMRIGGHFGLSYACIIPLLLWWLIKYSSSPNKKLLMSVFVFTLLMFFVHPYMGIGMSFLSFFFLSINGIISRVKLKQTIISVVMSGILPLLLFKLFMNITDTHEGRTNFVYGVDVYVSNIPDVFVSFFNGPFEHFMMQIIKVGHREWEGIAYVGFCINILIVVFTILYLINIKQYKFDKALLSLFLCAFIFLLMSFGLHNKLMNAMGIHIAALDQFRANGRFAWFFYYLFPVFLIVSLHKLIHERFNKIAKQLMIIAGVLYLGLNAIEGHAYMKARMTGSFRARNIFRPQQLNTEETALVSEIKKQNVQAILPLPFYHIGTDVLERDGVQSTYYSMLAAFHCKSPIISTQAARTSLTEAIEQIGLLNDLQDHENILKKFNNKPIAVIALPDLSMPDEISIAKKAGTVGLIGSNQLMILNVNDFHLSADQIYPKRTILKSTNDSAGILMRYFGEPKNKLNTNQAKTETLLKINQGQIPNGQYSLSLHYHFKAMEPKDIDCGIIVERFNGSALIDSIYYQVRKAYVYDSMFVFERNLVVDNNLNYKILSKGGSAMDYSINNLLLKPDSIITEYKLNKGLILINNRPLR